MGPVRRMHFSEVDLLLTDPGTQAGVGVGARVKQEKGARLAKHKRTRTVVD